MDSTHLTRGSVFPLTVLNRSLVPLAFSYGLLNALGDHFKVYFFVLPGKQKVESTVNYGEGTILNGFQPVNSSVAT